MATKVTREELYELVWKTPMSRLAVDFGVSDVALAKTCKRWNVPRPGRGYWAQLAAGLKVKRAPLPPSGSAESRWFFVERNENAAPRAPRPVPPPVSVPKDLRGAHDAIRALGAALGAAAKDQFGRLVVGDPTHPVLAVTVATHRRALTLLDALARALVAREHGILLRESGHHELAVVVAGRSMSISITERLDQRDHELTAEEKLRVERGSRYGIPKYDHFAGGRLQLVIGAKVLARHSWSDTSTRRLERTLGSIVLAVEAEVEARRQRQLAEEEQQRQEALRRKEQEDAQRRQREREARAKHEEALVKDLKEMARAWSQAQELRAFLRAVEVATPIEDRGDPMATWLAWAADRVRELDPLSQPGNVARRVEYEFPISGK